MARIKVSARIRLVVMWKERVRGLAFVLLTTFFCPVKSTVVA